MHIPSIITTIDKTRMEQEKGKQSLFYNDSISSTSSAPSIPDINKQPVIASTIQSQNIIPRANPQFKKFYESDSSFIVPKPQSLSHQNIIQRTKNKKRNNLLSRSKRKQSKKNPTNNKIGPWEFNKFIKKVYNEKGPIRNESVLWKTISKPLGDSLMQLVEENTNSAIDDIFIDYNHDLQRITRNKFGEIDKIYNLKQRLLNEILDKMNKKLRDSQFPSKFKSSDLDVETIVSKREYIQQLYKDEMRNVESIEITLQKEKEKLEESKKILQSIKLNKNKNLNEKLLKDDIHPALIPAIQNAYGMIGPSSGNVTNSSGNIPTAWKKDMAEMNLQLPTSMNNHSKKLTTDEENAAKLSMPSLKEYADINHELQDTVSNILHNGNLADTEAFFNSLGK